MPKYRTRLPQLSDRLFLTDAGMETYLIFHEGAELPCFASFDLMKSDAGVAQVRRYYARYATMARDAGLGFVFETPTWRANRDWGAKVGYDAQALADVNRRAVALMAEMRAEYETPRSPMVISGNIGPRGDGYNPERMMSAAEAEAYHAEQINVFRDTEADFVSAFTLNYVDEAIGVARAAQAAGMPAVISFTVETDGRLPTGQALKDAISETDAATASSPAYYMLNCAHPTHFADALAKDEPWTQAPARPARQCVDAQPCRARRRARSRRRQSGRARPAVSRPAQPHAAVHRARRLLRHRPSACRADLPRLHGGGAASGLVLRVQMRHQGGAVAVTRDGVRRHGAFDVRRCRHGDSVMSSAPIASRNCSRRLAPISGMTSSPRDATQAIASCAVVQPLSRAMAFSASTSTRLREKFSPWKRGMRPRISPGFDTPARV